MKSDQVRAVLIIILAQLAFSTGLVQEVLAVAAPAAGSMAYDIYDIAVNSILKGPIGVVAGIGAVAFGAFAAIQSKIMEAVPALLGGAALLKADAIVTSMGMLI
ncbi:MAG: hypothetical protein CSYNP_04008 [Syntrophus sp. SKADARSKE-3]|nr:hypothetical protein [Syntrophus sp. SKADARSKE-3]